MSTQKPRSDPYSRFIPREEIEGVSAWRFSAVDGSDELAAIEAAPVVAAAPAADESLLAHAREQAYAEGYQQGHKAGAQSVREAMEASMRRTAEETGLRMAQLLSTAREQLKASEHEVARQILDMAVDLARQVVRRELVQNTAQLPAVVQEALGQLIDDGLPATVRMNPSDLALMKGTLLDSLPEPRPELVADATVSPGGCLVASASNAVDATVQKRWQRVIGNLGLDTPFEPASAEA